MLCFITERSGPEGRIIWKASRPACLDCLDLHTFVFFITPRVAANRNRFQCNSGRDSLVWKTLRSRGSQLGPNCVLLSSLCGLSAPSLCTLTLIEPPSLRSSCTHCVLSHATCAGRGRYGVVPQLTRALTREFRVYSSLHTRQIDQDSPKSNSWRATKVPLHPHSYRTASPL